MFVLQFLFIDSINKILAIRIITNNNVAGFAKVSTLQIEYFYMKLKNCYYNWK